MEQATASARTAALGFSKQLHLGFSDCTAYTQLAQALVSYGAVAPEVRISISEVPLTQQLKSLRDGNLDASITFNGDKRDGIVAVPIASDPIVAVMAAEHPLAQDIDAPVDLRGQGLVLFGIESDLGVGAQIDCLVDAFGPFEVLGRASSLGAMLMMVGLGHGIGLIGESQTAGLKRTDVVVRPLRDVAPALTMYVLHADCGISEPLSIFIDHVRAMSLSVEPRAHFF